MVGILGAQGFSFTSRGKTMTLVVDRPPLILLCDVIVPSSKPCLSNRLALSRVASGERCRRLAIRVTELVGHILTSVLMSSSVQRLDMARLHGCARCHLANSILSIGRCIRPAPA
jgi:hypothetical protein